MQLKLTSLLISDLQKIYKCESDLYTIELNYSQIRTVIKPALIRRF